MKNKLLALLFGVAVVASAYSLAPVQLWDNVISYTKAATGTGITDVGIGNTTDNNTVHFLGTGVVNIGTATVATALNAPDINVTSSSVAPSYGLYRPTIATVSSLGFVCGGAQCGAFNANKEFIRFGGEADQSTLVDTTSTAGQTYTWADNISTVIHNPGATLASETVVTPPNPIDGAQIHGFCQQTITAFTLSPNTTVTAQTIKGAPTTCSINTGYAFQYKLASLAWYNMAITVTPAVFTSAASASTSVTAACVTQLSTTASGVTTSSHIVATASGDLGANITAITWPSAGQINTRICNPTAVPATPNSVTFNYSVN